MGTRRFAAAVAACVLLAACGRLKESPTEPDGNGPPDPTATFTRVQNEVFTPSCARAGCHDSSTRQQGMSLSAGDAYANTVGRTASEVAMARISPGEPAQSYLYLKITGAPGIVGQQMPLIGGPLPQDKINLIRDWIRRGAPND